MIPWKKTLYLSLVILPSIAGASEPLQVYRENPEIKEVSEESARNLIQGLPHYRLAFKCQPISTSRKISVNGDQSETDLGITAIAKCRSVDDVTFEIKAELLQRDQKKTSYAFARTDLFATVSVFRKWPSTVRAALWSDVDGDGKLDLVTLQEGRHRGHFRLAMDLTKSRRQMHFDGLLKAGGPGDASSEPGVGVSTLGLEEDRDNGGFRFTRSSDNGMLHAWDYQVKVGLASGEPMVESLSYRNETVNSGHGEANEVYDYYDYNFVEHVGASASPSGHLEEYPMPASCQLTLVSLDKRGVPRCAKNPARK